MRICALVAVVFLFSCRSDITHGSKKVFRYNEASGIISLDPAFAKDQSGIWPCLQLFNGLVQLDEKLLVQPCIAKEWTLSDSGTIYTFKLRTDVYFHKDACFKRQDSTRKVVADDFIYSFDRLRDDKVASPGAWVMQYLDDETPYSSPDDSTLIINLKKPFPAFTGLLSMAYCSVVPKEAIEKYGVGFGSHPCGTGPFRISYWKEGVRLILLKNENYFEKQNGEQLPFLDAVEISFIADKQSAFIEFLKGRLDFLSGIDASYKDELLTHSGKLQEKYAGKFRMTTEPYLNTEYLGILMDDPTSTLANKKIRQALSYGFDRKKMIAYLRNNIGTPGLFGMTPRGLPSFNSDSVYYDYDPGKTSSLLKEAGFPNGAGLGEIVLSTTNNYQDLCEYIKSQWEQFGFKVRIDINQAAVHRKMISEQKLAFFRGSWIADYPDAENYLSLFASENFAPSGPNYTHYSSQAFDRLLFQSQVAESDSERFMLYHRLDKMVMEDAPVIILYYDQVLRLTSNGIQDLKSNAMNNLILKNVRKS